VKYIKVTFMRTLQGLTALLSVAVAFSGANAASFIPDGSKTSKPFGHVAFCRANPKECSRTKASAPDVITTARWGLMQKINTAVNRQIKPVTDQQSTGSADNWSASVKSGDCEDYALSKRQKLIQAGFKSANLRLAMVRIQSGVAHLVLVVRTEKGDFILDNLNSVIKPWNQTGYRMVKIQAIGGGSEWIKIAA
jgi:predicted transglutaminase-like cysteine proteinase